MVRLEKDILYLVSRVRCVTENQMGKRKQVQVPVEKIEEQNRFIEAIAEKNSRYFAINKRKTK